MAITLNPDYFENFRTEKEKIEILILKIVSKMCNESLSPELLDKWQDVKRALQYARNL